MRVTVLAAYCASVAFLITLLVPFIRPSAAAARQRLAIRMLVPPAAVFAVTVGLAVNRYLTPRTFDVNLYAADASFGGQLGFAAGQMLASHSLLRAVSECAYINLPVAVVAAYLLAHRRSPERAHRFLVSSALAGAAGWLCYFVVPAVGSVVSAGGRFPLLPPTLAEFSATMPATLAAPRNCMPSLHATWGLLLVMMWAGRRTAVVLSALYAAPMLFYTLGCGHYFIDLVVAVPFAIAMYGLSSPSERRWKPAVIAALGMVGTWLIVCRFGLPLLRETPFVPWALALLTVTGSWRLFGHLQSAGEV